MNDGLKAASLLLARAAHALEHHPRHVTALLAALLLGGGGGAFAVASLVPEDAGLPAARTIIEQVAPANLQAQAEALDTHSFSLFRSEVTRASDTVDTLLARLGIGDAAAAAFLRGDAAIRQQLLGRGGRTVTAEATDNHALVQLSARWALDETRFQRLVVARDASGQWSSRVETANLVPSLRVGSGTLQTSLFAAVDEARIPDAVALQLVDIFSGAIDFNRGMRRGDRFTVVYETLEGDGEPLRTGRVVSTEFVNNNRPHQAMWFQQAGGKGGYYNFAGQSLERAYLASPMEFSRITSTFAMRLHPIHKTWRAHLGVDYGAPTGTPVRSIGEGVVSFAGVQNGYGNVVVIDHGKGDTTLYGHLSRIDVRKGQGVARGTHIGAVGATGWATGPHLHFEFRENGQHKDPLMAVRQKQVEELSTAARPAFEKAVAAMRVQIDAVGGPRSSVTASAQ